MTVSAINQTKNSAIPAAPATNPDPTWRAEAPERGAAVAEARAEEAADPIAAVAVRTAVPEVTVWTPDATADETIEAEEKCQ